MERQDLRSVVVAAVTDVLAEEPVDDDAADLREQGMTSVEMVSLLMALEDELGIAIPDDLLDPQNFASLERIVATVSPLVAR
ncbi:phosphopantetheine-binding protein [Saccharothrix syringae]|uniref:phosphopantetheine-binding protein n=1 Tax=Saccharothrix syringae TaxID=103733 RepID=UPI000524592E|nr:phosphopantetheine-binding protein [Saccharothrix syringae]